MDISKYYYLKQLDGKYHIFKRTEIKHQIKITELYAVDDPEEANDLINELNEEDESDDNRLLNI